MAWVCSLIYIFVAFLGSKIRGKKLNFLTIFSGYYALMITLSNFNFLKVNSGSFDAYLLLSIGVISFSIGYLFVIALFQNQRKKYYIANRPLMVEEKINIISKHQYEFRRYIIMIIWMFVLSYSCYKIYLSYHLLDSGYTISQIRGMYFDNAEAGKNRIDYYLFIPLQLILIFISCIYIFSNDIQRPFKIRIIFLVSVFITVVLSMFSNGGREIIFYTIAEIVFCFLLTRSKENADKERRRLNRKQKRIILIISLISIFTIATVTFNRRNVDRTLSFLLNEAYLYFTGWIPNLSIRLQNIDSANYTHGYAFILGLIKFPAAILHYLFNVPASNNYLLAESITKDLQQRVSIGGGITFNAYVSCFYYFFRDFGYFSLIVESMIFGIFCAATEKKWENSPNIFNLFWVLFAFYLIVSSMVRWEMVHPKTAMVLYFAPFLFKKSKNANKNYE